MTQEYGAPTMHPYAQPPSRTPSNLPLDPSRGRVLNPGCLWLVWYSRADASRCNHLIIL